MVITPQQASEISDKEKILSTLEEIIDAKIREQFVPNKIELVECEIDSRRKPHLTYRIRDGIIRRYEQAGWEVEQRYSEDSYCLKLRPKKLTSKLVSEKEAEY